jgi:hypothetical protein
LAKSTAHEFDGKYQRMLEEALIEYVERYGLTDKARAAMMQMLVVGLDRAGGDAAIGEEDQA